MGLRKPTSLNRVCISKPLRELIAEQMGVNVIVDNDANFTALEEFRLGSARGLTNFVYFLMSAQAQGAHFAIRCLGTTIFLDGRLYRAFAPGVCTGGSVAGEVDTLLKSEPRVGVTLEPTRPRISGITTRSSTKCSATARLNPKTWFKSKRHEDALEYTYANRHTVLSGIG